jgi:hypothetical protein
MKKGIIGKNKSLVVVQKVTLLHQRKFVELCSVQNAEIHTGQTSVSAIRELINLLRRDT